MLLTANEGRQQHAFFIPQLGPAPKWCAFLDNIVEEMAEDPDDPNAFGTKNSVGEVYDNFKFLTLPQLRQLNLDHLVGTTRLLRPYMHGYFLAQKLYEEARLISNPDLWQEQRAKSIQEKISKERESRIRGSKKATTVKVNRKLAERILEREEKNERRRAKRVLEKGGDDDMLDADTVPAVEHVDEEDAQPGEGDTATSTAAGVLRDPRFAKLFQDEDFEVDETSHEFHAINPSTNTKLPKGLTAVEQEELESRRGSSDEDDSDGDEAEAKASRRPANRKKASQPQDDDKNRISTSSYKKSGHHNRAQRTPQMVVSSSNSKRPQQSRDKTFGARVSKMQDHDKDNSRKASFGGRNATVVGEREITFAPERKSKNRKPDAEEGGERGQRHDRNWKDRRSASGNVFRRM